MFGEFKKVCVLKIVSCDMSNNDFYRVRTRRSVSLLLRVHKGTDFLFKKHIVFGNKF